MRPISDIIKEARAGEKPEYDELLLCVIALTERIFYLNRELCYQDDAPTKPPAIKVITDAREFFQKEPIDCISIEGRILAGLQK